MEAEVKTKRTRKRKKLPKRNGHPRIMGPTVQLATTYPASPTPTVQPSLPPADSVSSFPSPIPEEEYDVTKESWYLPPDSKVRQTALQIIAMRISGMEDPQIADALKISQKSISPYIYRAGRNGWLNLDNPVERVQYELMHKVVRNLAEGLDDSVRHQTSGMPVKTAVALKIAEGTIFREQRTPEDSTGSQIVAIKIEMVNGAPTTMRPDTTGGIPNYLDAEVG